MDFAATHSSRRKVPRCVGSHPEAAFPRQTASSRGTKTFARRAQCRRWAKDFLMRGGGEINLEKALAAWRRRKSRLLLALKR